MPPLLRDRRFAPLFWAQALGAFNDNLVKAAAVLLIVTALPPGEGAVLVTLGGAVFVLPFFLFSSLAGALADGLAKARIAQAAKLAEIAIVALGALGFLLASPGLLLLTLFLLGTQAAFFGPVKFSLPPELLGERELMPANALLEASTFLAILLGTILGSLLILQPGGAMAIGAASLVVAAAGWLASRRIALRPPAKRLGPGWWNVLAGTRELARIASGRAGDRGMARMIAGISWVWAMAAVYLSLFPPFVADGLRTDETLVSVLLGAFALGVGAGSLLAQRLTGGRLDLTPLPFAALFMALFSLDFGLAAWSLVDGRPEPRSLVAWLLEPGAWRLLVDTFGLATAGGVFVVPLYAALQARAEEAARARTIAALNVASAFWMVAASLAVSAFFALDRGTGGALAGVTGNALLTVFLVMAALNLVGVVIVWRILPSHALKMILRLILRVLYRVEVMGLEHAYGAGEADRPAHRSPDRPLGSGKESRPSLSGGLVARPVLYVVNHVSFLDGALMMAFLPGLPAFAIDVGQANRWWLRPFHRIAGLYPVEPARPLAAKALIGELGRGRSCVVFPEGRLTITGALMKVFEGSAFIAERAHVPIVPVRIDGAEVTIFSRLKQGEVRRRWLPRITIRILSPVRLEVPKEVTGKARRDRATLLLYDVMSRLMFETSELGSNLWQALLHARERAGSAALAIEDPERRLTFGSLVRAASVMAQALEPRLGQAPAIGLMLPTSVPAAVAFFALQALGRTTALLNFTAGRKAISAALDAAGLETIITSRRFVEEAGLGPLIEALPASVRLVWLEEMAQGIGLRAKLRGLALDALGRRPEPGTGPDDPACILFTSGSEGLPKGVVLSHRNLIANVAQAGARIDANARDKLFNSLPLFHSFGLTGGLLLPLLSGFPTFLYPSPLHYRIVPELVYFSNATAMFGTDTFLRGYARSGDPYDFRSLRYVFAGAEPVQESTRELWMEKFGIRILEGYGTTETSPLIAVNTAMHHRKGTVGRLMPGMEARLEPVPGIALGGRLLVRGPNVMLGYLRPGGAGRLEPPPGGWHDTGDIVAIDEEGYIRILGRARRFAKIGGEMVSLAAVENLASAIWPEGRHAAIALPDPRKGERIVLVIQGAPGGRDRLAREARLRGISELALPAAIVEVRELPLLGSGKVDLARVKEIALEHNAAEAAS